MTEPLRALFVLTSHADLGGVRGTGFHVGEAADPWQVLCGAGVTVDLASIAGGIPPQDGRDPSDARQNAFLADQKVRDQIAATPRLADVDPASYDGVLFVGGHGAMWDFPGNADVGRVGRSIYEAGGVVAAVCHGPAALVDLRLSDGSNLVAGTTVAGFTNEEEAAVGLTGVVPFLLADALAASGATHTSGRKFREHVEVSGRLVTGQNPQSATRVGEEILALLRTAARA